VIRRTVSSVSPDAFGSGEIGRQTANEDNYFASGVEDVVRMVLDNFIKQLPPLQKAAVEMCIMSKMTYEEAAKEISLIRGVDTDKKTVWRWARSALEDLRQWLIDSPWVAAVTQGKIPVELLDAAIPIDLPWEDNDGS